IDDVWGDDPPETAGNVLQGYVSELRKAVGREWIETRGGGYALALDRDDFDLWRFERLVGEAAVAEPSVAAESLRAALRLWRGPALADLADVPFARAAIGRLEDLQLAALERRLEADLALGRHAQVTGELEALVAESPLREGLYALLMLALYRSGRQAEALQTYQAARRTLVDELGIEPGRALQDLHRAVLRQDPGLDLDPIPQTSRGEQTGRSILVVPGSDAAILPLVSIAEPLAHRPPRELIVLRLLHEGEEPAATTSRLSGLRDELTGRGLAMRVAAYTSPSRAEDVRLLATEQDVDLVLVDASPSLLVGGLPDADLATILRDVPSDVAVLVGGGSLHREAARPVFVPFGGADHDWSAVEIAAWSARALGTTLVLVGTSADRLRRRRDASRLLGRASMIVQAVVGIVAEPMLVRGGPDGILEAAGGASLLVLGLSGRWRAEGLGAARLEVARAAGVPTLVVRRGLRPGGLAPAESMTRFTWSLGPPVA